MAYSDFTIDRVRHELGITLDFSASLFDQVSPIAASDWLVDTLALMAPMAMANTEKARSEFMVAPILGELVKRLDYGIFVFSGKDFNVDSDRGLVGYCDFLVSRSPESISIQAPVCTIVEAKKEDINGGIAQCIAEMVAAQIFNERKGAAIAEAEFERSEKAAAIAQAQHQQTQAIVKLLSIGLPSEQIALALGVEMAIVQAMVSL